MRVSDRAYATLYADIVEWRLSPGDVLAEVEQSDRLGISRTPLREALTRLVADGLASPHTGRGVVVSAVSREAVADLFEVRIPLECTAVRRAARRGPGPVFGQLAVEFAGAGALIEDGDEGRAAYYALVDRLDTAVDHAAANPYLLQAQRPLRAQLRRIRRLTSENRARLLASAREHGQIADALARGDEELADAALRLHLHHSLHHLLTAEDLGGTPHPRKEHHGRPAPRPRPSQ